mgnify:CR=1 FL=1
MEEISWNDFMKVELRVGRVLQAEVFPEARKPAYKLMVDFGPELGQRKSSAQITQLYQPQDLVGKLVVGVLVIALFENSMARLRFCATSRVTWAGFGFAFLAFVSLLVA